MCAAYNVKSNLRTNYFWPQKRTVGGGWLLYAIKTCLYKFTCTTLVLWKKSFFFARTKVELPKKFMARKWAENGLANALPCHIPFLRCCACVYAFILAPNSGSVQCSQIVLKSLRQPIRLHCFFPHKLLLFSISVFRPYCRCCCFYNYHRRIAFCP